MSAKGLLRIALLVFVAAAVVLMVRREMDDSAGGAADVDAAAQSLPADGLVVYYFHSNVRCPTCQTIEGYAHDAVSNRLGDKLASGEVAWVTLNYEAPENAHFVKEYEIAAPTVVLVHREQGRDGEWRNLMRVWELVGDKQSFEDYVAEEAADLLAAQ